MGGHPIEGAEVNRSMAGPEKDRRLSLNLTSVALSTEIEKRCDAMDEGDLIARIENCGKSKSETEWQKSILHQHHNSLSTWKRSISPLWAILRQKTKSRSFLETGGQREKEEGDEATNRQRNKTTRSSLGGSSVNKTETEMVAFQQRSSSQSITILDTGQRSSVSSGGWGGQAPRQSMRL